MKRLLPRIGGSAVPDLLGLGAGGSNLQDVTVEPQSARNELDSARGLELAVARMDDSGEDVFDRACRPSRRRRSWIGRRAS